MHAYARRLGLSFSTAIARLLVCGALRVEALRRYNDSPRGRRVRRLQTARRAERARRHGARP